MTRTPSGTEEQPKRQPPAEADAEGDQQDQPILLADFSDKNLQKLVKLTDQQIDRVKHVTVSIDKSTQALKRVNKGYRTQAQQLQ